MEDAALIRASQIGDKEAFGSLIDRYHKDVYRLAYHYAGSHHEADDACQETFLRAYSNIKKLREVGKFKGWLFTITINYLRRQISSAKSRPAVRLEDIAGGQSEIADRNPSGPLESLHLKEKYSIIEDELKQMPERMRISAIMVIMQGFTQKETAKTMNYSEASVSRDLEIARNRLQDRLSILIDESGGI